MHGVAQGQDSGRVQHHLPLICLVFSHSQMFQRGPDQHIHNLDPRIAHRETAHRPRRHHGFHG